MAKATKQPAFDGFKRLIKVIKLTTEKGPAKEKLFNDVAKYVLDRILSMTRTGNSIAGKSKTKLKELSDSYKSMRKGKARFRKTKDGGLIVSKERDEKLDEVDHEYFKPTKSNLTFSGQMLKALGFLTLSSQSKIVFSVDGSKRTGKYEKLTNKQVAEHVAANGRPFLGLDKLGLERVAKIIKTSIREEIIKSRLKKR